MIPPRDVGGHLKTCRICMQYYEKLKASYLMDQVAGLLPTDMALFQGQNTERPIPG